VQKKSKSSKGESMKHLEALEKNGCCFEERTK
jgi:hypothetical protein